MNHIKISGCGRALPKNKILFQEDTRYRLGSDETFMGLIQCAIEKAFLNANLSVADIDCIVCAMATPMQAIPCNAALIHEQIAKGLTIPAMDINTSCTSFIAALDTMSYLLQAKKYHRVLIVSGDYASAALNPKEKESFELFSDAVTAFIVEQTEEDCGVLYSKQKTWSEGAHHTEIPRGGSLSTAFVMTKENHDEYYFTMDGIRVLKLCSKVLRPFIDECFLQSKLSRSEIDLIIPHQASRALPMIMKRLGFEKGSYLDLVSEYGNMVSASVPFMLCDVIEKGKIKRGDTVVLLGTAAGLTANFLVLKY